MPLQLSAAGPRTSPEGAGVFARWAPLGNSGAQKGTLCDADHEVILASHNVPFCAGAWQRAIAAAWRRRRAPTFGAVGGWFDQVNGSATHGA